MKVNSAHMIGFYLLTVTNIFMASCSKDVPIQIKYLLPDGYGGIVKIVLDPVNGIPLNVRNNQITIVIPPTGILSVDTFDPFHEWHVRRAQYQNGHIVTTDHDVHINPQTVAFRGIAEYSGGTDPPTLVFIVGTEKEVDAYRRNPY